MSKKKEFRKRIEKILKRLNKKPDWLLPRQYYPDVAVTLEDYQNTKSSRPECQCHLEKSKRWEWGWSEKDQRYTYQLETYWRPRFDESYNQQEGGWGGVMDDDGWNFNSWYR